jgi:hypothetical protein
MTWPTWLTHNPLAWVALLNGGVDLAVAFGVPIDSPEKAAISVFLGLISVMFVQSQTTSTAKLTSLGVTISSATQVASVGPVPPPAAPTIPVTIIKQQPPVGP